MPRNHTVNGNTHAASALKQRKRTQPASGGGQATVYDIIGPDGKVLDTVVLPLAEVAEVV